MPNVRKLFAALKHQLSARQTLIVCVMVAISAFCAGLDKGWRTAPRGTTISFENPLIVEKDEVFNQLSQGIVDLVNCTTFHRRYPKAWNALMTTVKTEVSLAYEPTMLTAYAAAYPGTSLIILGPAFFSQTERTREAILAHEMLHVINVFAGHRYADSGEVIKKGDKVYEIIDSCFHELDYR